MEYKRTTHAVYGLQYHIILVTKYRKKCINEEIGGRLKKRIRQADITKRRKNPVYRSDGRPCAYTGGNEPKICYRKRNSYA